MHEGGSRIEAAKVEERVNVGGQEIIEGVQCFKICRWHIVAIYFMLIGQSMSDGKVGVWCSEQLHHHFRVLRVIF